MYGNSTSAYEAICSVVGWVMAHPYLTLRTTRNRLFSYYVAGSQNPQPLAMGSVKAVLFLVNALLFLAPRHKKRLFSVILWTTLRMAQGYGARDQNTCPLSA